MSETIMFPTNYELVVKDKATAMQYAISQARVYNNETRCYDLDLEIAKSIYKFFCDNVNLPDVDNGCCYECKPILTEEELHKMQEENLEMMIRKEKEPFAFEVKIKAETYDDVSRELFWDKECISIGDYGGIYACKPTLGYAYYASFCTSLKQAEKLLAINKLLNVAKYLNGVWKPQLDNKEIKYYIEIDEDSNVVANWCIDLNSKIVYFNSEQLAQRAIQILGEDTIRLALSTDY